MDDLIETDADGRNEPEYSVSEISGAVKRTIEGAFGRVRVRGEVGRVMHARSGHLYFDIKDDRSVLAAVSWKGQVARLSVRPEEGMEVIATGKLTTFGSQSRYQLNVEDVVVAGEGALMAMLEKRKKALAAEGLFAPERKKPLPFLPEVIGVVTSPSGAVIRDILHRLRDRFPRKVLIWPVAVQGQSCAGEVANAIAGFNALTPGGALPRPDLLIVARGGGSIEDLWGFNEEIVARAAAASDIPLISAVGHETDTTLIDYVADRRAPTPTAAAEFAVPVRLELLGWLEEQGSRLTRSLGQGVNLRQQRLRDLTRALPHPATLIAQAQQRLDYASNRLGPSLRGVTQQKRVTLAELAANLRPAALRRLTREAREKLNDRSGRLRAEPILLRVETGRREVQKLSLRLDRAFAAHVDRAGHKLTAQGRMLETLSYTGTLKRGFAVVRSGDQVLTTAKAAESAGVTEIEFHDGRYAVHPGTAPAKPAKPRAKPPKPEQGSLF